MKTSLEGQHLIEHFEGLRLKAYQDIVGVWTVGYGHTGKDVHPGMYITQEYAEHLLRDDLMKAERAVGHYYTKPLTQGQFDALVSFTYNLGASALHGSTLMKKMNRGDFDGAANEFHKWNHAGGREISGLTRRRAEEKTRFVS